MLRTFANLHVTGVFGFDQSVLHTGTSLREIEDLAFADAGGLRQSDAEDFHRAVGLHFADDHAGLAGSDFETDVNFRTCHGAGAENGKGEVSRD